MKIYIIGSVASGKTTFSKKLAKVLKIEVYEMDNIVHDDKLKIKRSLEEQKKIIDSILIKDSWIIEGTHRKNMDFLLKEADRIIFLDIPLKVRKRRILIRWIKQKLKLEKCGYKANINMLKNMYSWTIQFENNKKEMLKKLYKYGDKLIIQNKNSI